MNRKFWNDQFEVRANTPAIWALQARRLRCAADIILEAYVSDLSMMQAGIPPLDLANLETIGPGTLLYGLAFENILKALIVRNEGPQIQNGKLKKWSGNGHGLVHLANRAGVGLTSPQHDLLSRLTAFVEWGGRYPVPMSQNKMPLKQDAVVPEWFPLPVQPHELPAVRAFFETLSSRILGN